MDKVCVWLGMGGIKKYKTDKDASDLFDKMSFFSIPVITHIISRWSISLHGSNSCSAEMHNKANLKASHCITDPLCGKALPHIRWVWWQKGHHGHTQMVNIMTEGTWTQVTLCRSFFADVPDHSRPSRSVMIVTKPSDRGHNSRSLSVQDCLYDLSTTTARHWYDGSVWSTLSTFSTTISTTTDTIDTTALTMSTTTPTLLPICYHD